MHRRRTSQPNKYININNIYKRLSRQKSARHVLLVGSSTFKAEGEFPVTATLSLFRAVISSFRERLQLYLDESLNSGNCAPTHIFFQLLPTYTINQSDKAVICETVAYLLLLFSTMTMTGQSLTTIEMS